MTPRVLLWTVLLTASALAGCASTDAPEPGADPGTPAPVTDLATQAATSAVPPGTYDLTGPYSRVLTAGPFKIKTPEHVYIPGVGGADIEMGVWRPDTTEKAPVLVMASPYYGFTLGIGSTVVDKSGYFGNLIDNFVPHGYAVVGLSVRGTGDSGGCNDLMGPNERSDIDSALTWLGTQDWSNGNIAMTGLSYDGSTPWTGAATGNPHLKTIIPISGVPDLYGLMYRNGSAEDRGPLLLNTLYYSQDMVTWGASPQHTLEKALCPEAIEGILWSGYSGVMGDPDPQGFWDARNRKPLVEENYKGSVFIVQGLQDWNVDSSQVVPWADDLESLGLRVKQLYGQWVHTYPDSIGDGGTDAKDMRADYNEILLRWMDHELKGIDVDTGPAVEVRDGLGQWRVEAHYPPHDATWTTYHLSGSLLTDEPGPRASALLYPQVAPGIPPSPPPAVDLGVAGAAVFTLGPMKEDLRIAGLPKVHVTVTPSGPGGYIGAYLYDLDPSVGLQCQDGRRLGWTTMNLAFADGGRVRHEVQAGQAIRALMEIQPLDDVVPAGHVLGLCVWVYTEGTGTDVRLPTIPPAPVSLEMGGDVESVFILPTVVRDESVYFDVPQ